MIYFNMYVRKHESQFNRYVQMSHETELLAMLPLTKMALFNFKMIDR